MAHIEVDGEAEQQNQDERYANDHREGQAIARELAHFLACHGRNSL
jgi:hypothetical protein